MQSKTRVELRLKVKILFKMSNWEKDSGWSRKKNRLITLGHHRVPCISDDKQKSHNRRLCRNVFTGKSVTRSMNRSDLFGYQNEGSGQSPFMLSTNHIARKLATLTSNPRDRVEYK